MTSCNSVEMNSTAAPRFRSLKQSIMHAFHCAQVKPAGGLGGDVEDRFRVQLPGHDDLLLVSS